MEHLLEFVFCEVLPQGCLEQRINIHIPYNGNVNVSWTQLNDKNHGN